MRAPVIMACVAAAALGGCGQSSSPSGPGPSPAANRAARHLLGPGLRAVPAPAPTHRPADASAVRVIRAWSTALRTGHIAAAAGWFATPSEFVNGIGSGGTVAAVRIGSLRAAIAANETLPCGARFISADQRGPYVNALFTLTGRRGPGGAASCGAPGQTARTNFLIADGRIVEWIRAPDDPGDNGSSGGGGGGVNPGGPRQGTGTATGPQV